jgi:hypothetical protein
MVLGYWYPRSRSIGQNPIGIGDRPKRVELSAPWTRVRVDGSVKHKSRTHKRIYRDYHPLEIEPDEELEYFA